MCFVAVMLFSAMAHLQARPGSAAPIPKSHVPQYTYKVIRVFPHDPNAFTQGLAYRDGFFYEGTGLEGHSSLRKVDLQTGKVLHEVDLAPALFGEGITIVGNEIFQLTWHAQTGFVYSLKGFRQLRQFSYSGEGWGLATNGRDIFMSDGTAEIRVLDPHTLKEKRRLQVHDGNLPVKELNELEYVNGEIFANVWQADRIARISPQTGEVVGWINLKGLISPVFRRNGDAVLNGIAYDPVGKRLFVTGKLWPSIFEIRIVRKKP